VPSSQFVEEHLGEPMNLSSPCAFARLPLRSSVLVPAPLAVPVHALHHDQRVRHLRSAEAKSSIPLNSWQPLDGKKSLDRGAGDGKDC